MRRALDTKLEEIRNDRSVVESYRLGRIEGLLIAKEVIAEALSRADEGKESEGGCTECGGSGSIEIDDDHFIKCKCAPSDPTPPDATAQRDAIGRIIDPNAWQYLDAAYEEDREDSLEKADAILALQTRAGG